VPITALYVILGISAVLLVGVGIAIFRRIRRLARASQTQFVRAVRSEENPDEPAPRLQPKPGDPVVR